MDIEEIGAAAMVAAVAARQATDRTALEMEMIRQAAEGRAALAAMLAEAGIGRHLDTTA
jgi:hypothetical protein